MFNKFKLLEYHNFSGSGRRYSVLTPIILIMLLFSDLGFEMNKKQHRMKHLKCQPG